jgi:hypothetical protein
MLFVSNTLDPVTPLHRYLDFTSNDNSEYVLKPASAKHMSKQFPGSVLLEQDSEGVSYTSTVLKDSLELIQVTISTPPSPHLHYASQSLSEFTSRLGYSLSLALSARRT